MNKNTTDTTADTTVTDTTVVQEVIDLLALAHGGRSQYSWQALGSALRGQVAQGRLQGADPARVVALAVALELEYWCDVDTTPDAEALIKAQILEMLK